MSITIKEVEHIALLARLEFSDEEKQLFTEQLGRILDYIAKMNELDTTNVPPTSHVLPLTNVFRNDEVLESLPKDDVLANAPSRERDLFKVPPVISS